MKISFINDVNIIDKKCVNNYVDGVEVADTLTELAEYLVKYSITPATFKQCEWNVDFTSNADVQCKSIGQTRQWKYKANVEQCELLAFDFDNGTSPESIHEQFKSFNHVIAASLNHMVDKGDGKGIIPRFHLFIKLDAPIVSSEFYTFLSKEVASEYKIDIDGATLEMSRYYFKHKCCLFISDRASDFDVKKYSFIYRRKQSADRLHALLRMERKTDTPSLQQLRNSRWFQNDIAPLLMPGSYHMAQLKQISFLKKLGYSRDDCVDFALTSKGTCESGDCAKYGRTYDKAS